MKLTPLIEDLERLQFKLLVESELQSTDQSLAKRLTDLAVETADAVERARALLFESELTRSFS